MNIKLNTKVFILFFSTCYLTYSQSNISSNKVNLSYQSSNEEEGLIRNNNKVGAWKKYNGKSLTEVIYYYEGKVKFALDKDDFELENNNKFVYDELKIETPKHWSIVDSKGKSLLTLQKNINKKNTFSPTFSITKIKLNGQYNFEENVKNISSYFLNNKKEFKIIQNRLIQTKIKGYTSAKLVFTFKDGEENYGTILLMLKSDKDILILTGTSLLEDNQFLKYKCVFEEVFSTLKFDNNLIFDKLNVIY